MATLVMSPSYEYGSFKSTTQKGHSLQGRKSPITNSHRKNSTNFTKLASPPHSRVTQIQQHHHQQEQQQQQQQQPSSPNAKTSPEAPSRKLERAMSDPAERRSSPSSPTGNTTGNSNSSRYKTELCRPFEESGTCKYGDKCQFAHGMKELRTLARHPKYKTELCRSFHTTGLCPYGPRCHFIHNSDQSKATIISALSAPSNRPKTSSIGSSNDGSPPPSQSGSPTMIGSNEDFFQYPSSTQTAFPFPPLEPMPRGGSGYMEYTTHEFNPDFYDTPSVFQERILSSVMGSPVTVPPSDALDRDPTQLCGSPPALELFPTSPTSSPNGFSSFPVFSLFSKDH